VIVVVLAFVVLPADADPTPPTPTKPAIVRPTNDVAETALEPTDTPEPTRRAGRNLALEILPTSTPRVIRRPDLDPTVTPTESVKTPTLADQELVANGDFEVVDSSWYLEPGAIVATGDAHGGNGLLFIETTGGYADQRVAIDAGVTYQVSVWARVSNDRAEAAEIGVRYEDNAYNAVPTIDPIQIQISDQSWTNVVVTFTPPDGASQALISFWNPPGNGSFSIDDVSVRAFIAS
jgi:hypothetical protein